MRIAFFNFCLLSLFLLSFSFLEKSVQGQENNSVMEKKDEELFNWVKHNISPKTKMPLSFQIPSGRNQQVYQEMGSADSVNAIIERVIVDEGLEVYDGAVAQIVLTLNGGEENLAQAFLPLEVYWQGHLGELTNIRSGYPDQPFIYDPNNPTVVSSDLSKEGQRGFVFRLIDAHGQYNTSDPLDGKTEFKDFPTWPTVHWEDWKPIAGENAWIVLAAMQLFHKKYFVAGEGRYQRPAREGIELKLAEELARAALLLQAENGGIRMSPMGTYYGFSDPEQESSLLTAEEELHNSWWYNSISTENNISWYAALRTLYTVTQRVVYRQAMDKIESYFKSVWNADEKFFYQGAHWKDGL